MKKAMLAMQGVNIPLSVYLSITNLSSLGSFLWLANAVIGGVWVARNIDKVLDDRKNFEKYFEKYRKEFKADGEE